MKRAQTDPKQAQHTLLSTPDGLELLFFGKFCFLSLLLVLLCHHLGPILGAFWAAWCAHMAPEMDRDSPSWA